MENAFHTKILLNLVLSLIQKTSQNTFFSPSNITENIDSYYCAKELSGSQLLCIILFLILRNWF